VTGLATPAASSDVGREPPDLGDPELTVPPRTLNSTNSLENALAWTEAVPATPAEAAELDLLEALPFYAMLVDSRRHILYANGAVRRDLPDPGILLPGATCPQVMHGLDHPCPDCPLEDAMRTGADTLEERELFDARSGRWFRITIYATARRTPDGRRIWLHFAQDISEQKAVTEERDFLYRVQEVVADLLRIGLQPLTLDEHLARMLEHVLAVPWLGLRPRGAVFLVCDEARTLEMRASRGMDAPVREACARVAAGSCLCGRAALEGEVQFASRVDERHETRYPSMTPHGHYCVPIRSQESLLGVLCLYVAEGHERSRQEERFLAAVADVMANVILHQRVLALFEQAAVGVAQIETETGRVVRINQKGCDIAGRTRKEMAEATFQEISHPDDRVLLLEHLARVRSGAHRELSLEQRCQHPSGAVVWARLTLSPMWPLGAASGYCIAVIEDVTARKVAELALAESEERFRSLFEAMTEGVALHEMVHDERGNAVDYRVLDVNPAFYKQAGIRRQDAVGRTASELYGTSPAPYLEVYARVAATGVPASFEVHFDPMGRYFRISAFCPGKGHFATVFEDITERRQMELALVRSSAALREQNEELDAFAHMVAHDLKTPLTVITGHAVLLRAGHEDLRKGVDAIERSSQQMVRIIDELLLLAKVRQTDERGQPLDMAAIVAASLRDLAELVGQHGGEVIVPPSWPAALGHAPWVQQVWVNYLSNALKHGGRPPRVELGASVQGDGLVRFWVKDNGRGLTADERARLFAPFSRLAVRTDGHGLGLSIVRRIVEKMGGTAGVESAGRGTGSTFSFTLPPA
jgi:PAS domain S-box-containing protein